MNHRTRLVLICVFLAAVAVTASGATPEELADVLNFSASLADLDEATRSGAGGLLQDDRFFVVEGVVAAIEIVSPDPDNFVAELELVSGRWQGVTSVESYRAVVRVAGPAFAARIPTRPSRNPPPGIIETNQRLLIVARIGEVRGPGTVVLDALYARAIR